MQTYSVRDIRDRFGVTSNTVLAWIHTGQLRAISVARHTGTKPRWRITAEALAEFERRRSNAPPAPTPTRRRRAERVTEYYVDTAPVG